jgi:phage major head subunit gpT-like protein
MPVLNIAGQANLDAARIGFHAAFMEQLGIAPEQPLEKLLLPVPSTTAVEEWQWLGDAPGFTEWTQDRRMDTMGAFKLRLANKEWASGLKIHQRQFRDDKLGLFSAAVAEMAIAARQHRADFAAKLLINGMAGTAFPETGVGLAWDGKFFFDTTRVTGSKKLTVALDLTGAGLDAAETLLSSQTTYDGKRKLRGVRGTHLICGPKLAPIAYKLMRNDFITDGTTTVSNPYKGRYEIVVEPWLTGTQDDWWFLADCSKPTKPLMLQMREEITTSALVGQSGGDHDSLPRFQRGELWFGAEASYNEGYFDPRLIVGSQVA